MTLAGRLAWNAWPFELITNFPVQLLIVGALSLLGSALLRARVTIAIAALGLVLNGLVVFATISTEVRPARLGSPSIAIGHLNAQTRPVDVDRIGAYVRAAKLDVFVVLDPTQRDVPRLTAAAPTYRAYTTGSAPGIHTAFVRAVVLSRIPATEVDHPVDRAFGASAVEFTLGGSLPTSVVVLGTDSPTTPARAQHRDRALDAAARWSRAHPERRIVMGDLNATPWSPSFQRLLHHGKLFNSLDGFGLQVSWPESNVLLRIPIDHALLGPALAATDRGTGPAFGSQHRSLHVTVVERQP